MAEVTKLIHKYLRHEKKFPHVWCPGCGNGIVLGALIRAIDRPMFGVHLDPVNLINCPQRYFDNAELLRECFSVLGSWLISCHGKDILLQENIHELHIVSDGRLGKEIKRPFWLDERITGVG